MAYLVPKTATVEFDKVSLAHGCLEVLVLTCSCNDSSLWGEFIIVCRLFWCCKEISKVHSTYFVMDVVVHSRNSIILICSRVKQAKALHAHGVNCVGDRLIEILRQKVRSIQLRARRLNSCSWAAEKRGNQQEEIHTYCHFAQVFVLVDTFWCR